MLQLHFDINALLVNVMGQRLHLKLLICKVAMQNNGGHNILPHPPPSTVCGGVSNKLSQLSRKLGKNNSVLCLNTCFCYVIFIL